jgi:hypothetical protein
LSCDAAELKELKSALDSRLTELGLFLWIVVDGNRIDPPIYGNFSRETTGKLSYNYMILYEYE